MDWLKKDFNAKILFILSIFIIYLASIFVQSNLFLNVDVSWLIEASKRMLSGGTYTKDFFENNPPWILYFYIPVTLLESFFSISVVLSAKIYFYVLASVSLGFSYYFAKKIFLKSDYLIAYIMILMLAIIFLLLPLYELGQREHLVLMFCVPYLLMLTDQLQNKSYIHPYLAMFIGLLTGTTFILKPYFLIPWMLMESYVVLCKKNIFAWMRPEVITIMALSVAYIFLIIFRHPDYLSLVVPFAMRVCYYGSHRSFAFLLYDQIVNFCFLTILFFVVTYEINRYKHLTILVLLAIIGFLLSYFFQQVNYTYRILPAFSLSIVLLGLLSCFYAAQQPNQKNHVSILMCGFVLLLMPFLSQVLKSFLFYLNDFMSLVAIVFFSMCFIVLFFIRKNKHHFFSGMLAVAFSLFPMNYFYLSYTHLTDMMRYTSQSLVDYLNQNANHESVYFFSTTLSHTFPTVINAKDTVSASRFSGFWMLAALIKRTYFPMNQQQRAVLDRDMHFFVNMVSEDLKVKQPHLIFIDDLAEKTMLFFDIPTKQGYFKQKYISFDYLNYFKKNPDFNDVFKHYKYKTTIRNIRQVAIHPFLYHFKLEYHIPADDMVQSNYLYLYLNSKGYLEVALQDVLGDIKRIALKFKQADISANQLDAIIKTASVPGAKLNKRDRKMILSFISKQTIGYEMYRFKIYERDN